MSNTGVNYRADLKDWSTWVSYRIDLQEGLTAQRRFKEVTYRGELQGLPKGVTYWADQEG